MTIPIKRFEGTLEVKTLHDFQKELDYTIEKQYDRIKAVEKITNDDKGFSKDYFSGFFEQREEDGINLSHLKTNVKQNGYLAYDMKIFKQLEKMADYILFAPDAKPLTIKTKYRFYTDSVMERKLAREDSIEAISENASKSTRDGFSSDVVGEVIEFLIRKGLNYKLESKQKILKKDFSDDKLVCVKELQQYIDKLKEKIKEINENNGNKKTLYFYTKQIGLYKQDQLILKDMIKRTIKFKSVTESNGQPQYLKMFNFTDWKQVKALLKIGNKSIKSDLGCLTHDLNSLISEIKISNRDKRIIRLWREDDMTEETISQVINNELCCDEKLSQQTVNYILKRVSKQIVKKYMERKTNWIYLNHIKGTYKKCSKCGETKLVQMFGVDKTRQDGLRIYCKKCRIK